MPGEHGFMTIAEVKKKLEWMLTSGSTDGRSFRALIKRLIADIEEAEQDEHSTSDGGQD
jgi:hypothetical protein